ncbi:MAG: hypothetical protein NTW96_07100 [Planctomycetia bacterium]|nr:hypothetical protein [Planctomycetia bacterium]
MEELTSPSPPETTQADVLVQTFQRQRSQVDTFLAAHRKRLLAAEANLAARIDRIARELVQVRSQAGHIEGTLSTRSEEIEQKARDVALLKEEFETAQVGWQAAQDQASRQQRQLADEIQRQQETLQTRLGELTARHLELAEAEAKLGHERESFALARQRNEEEAQRLEAERESLRQRRAELDTEREELAAGRTHTEGQRRRMAREFEARRAADRKDLERRRAEIEQLAAKGAALEAQRGEAAADLESHADLDDSRRRYEMALEDLRELRAENENLKKQLGESRVAGASAKGGAPEILDWEAQKRRLLEALEAEFDENKEETVQERLKIEQVIATTDRIIAQKDREIDDLQELLREQSSQVGAVAVGASAFAETIDKDAVIREERENLRRLQAELREKLRKAEIDISIERATIARERLDIDEKTRALGRHDAAKASPNAGQPPERPARGRWLSRLGLKDVDESDA